MKTYSITPSSTGDLSLATRLAASEPGDIVNLAPGRYGCPGLPTLWEQSADGVTYQCLDGRATLDGALVITGHNTTFRGLEVALLSHTHRATTNPANPPWPDFELPTCTGVARDFCRSGFNILSKGVRLFDCVARDCVGGGFGTASSSGDILLYNCTAYRNGWKVSGSKPAGHGHGFYIQNGSGRITIESCVSFGNYNFAAQTSGNNSPVCDFISWLDNVFAITSELGVGTAGLFTVGAWSGVTAGAIITGNRLFDHADKDVSADANLGYNGGLTGAVIKDNTFPRPLFKATNSVTTPNTTYPVRWDGALGKNVAVYPTTGLQIHPIANRYRPGGRIVVYNWAKAGTVTVPAFGLPVGSAVRVANDLNPADSFPAEVTAAGISVPMNRSVIAPLRNCYPTFGSVTVTPISSIPVPMPVPVPVPVPAPIRIIPTVAELDTIPGVGLTLAKRIRAFLEAYKP